MELKVNDNGSQGTNSHDIVDAWVYADGEFIGVFELPTRVPILKSGTTNLTILAGIKRNGLATDRAPYPFFKSYNLEYDLVEARVDTLIPVIEYNEALNFVWMEDFEDGRISLEKTGTITTVDSISITNQPNEVFSYDGVDNNASGVVKIDTGLQFMEFSSVQLFDLPRQGNEIYLELNYKTDVELIVGLYPISGNVVQRVPVVNLFPTNEWRKAYISLKEDVNASEFQGLDFRLVFGAQSNAKTGNNFVYLDNLKLMHF
jgi:hypothetical protein